MDEKEEVAQAMCWSDLQCQFAGAVVQMTGASVAHLELKHERENHFHGSY